MASELMDSVREFLFPGRFVRRAIAPLDSGLTPNDRLENLVGALDVEVEEPDDAVLLDDGSVLVSSRGQLLRSWQGTTSVFATLPGEAGPVVLAPDGTVFVGVAGVGLCQVSQDGSATVVITGDEDGPLHCVTDLALGPSGTLYLTNGSTEFSGDDWVRDLMAQNTSGRVVRVDLATGTGSVLARNLAYPAGITMVDEGRRLVVCEAWAHRIISIDVASSSVEVLRDNFPGYPGRINADRDGRLWLAVFALRTQLVEFVLSQRDFVDEMTRTIDPDFWIRPALRSLNSGLEPLQGGQIRKLGVVKPWAPPRSYGLVAILDADANVVESWHSRGGGTRHGVTSVRTCGDQLVVVVRGAHQVVVSDKRDRDEH